MSTNPRLIKDVVPGYQLLVANYLGQTADHKLIDSPWHRTQGINMNPENLKSNMDNASKKQKGEQEKDDKEK